MSLLDEGVRQRVVGRAYLRIGLATPERLELQRGTGVLRNELDEPGIERRGDELARTEVERPLHVEALRLHGLAVDLRQELALGEVERTDRDRVVARARPGRRARRQRHAPNVRNQPATTRTWMTRVRPMSRGLRDRRRFQLEHIAADVPQQREERAERRLVRDDPVDDRPARTPMATVTSPKRQRNWSAVIAGRTPPTTKRYLDATSLPPSERDSSRRASHHPTRQFHPGWMRPGGRLRSDQAELAAAGDGVVARPHVELAVEALRVALHGVEREEELRGDLALATRSLAGSGAPRARDRSGRPPTRRIGARSRLHRGPCAPRRSRGPAPPRARTGSAAATSRASSIACRAASRSPAASSASARLVSAETRLVGRPQICGEHRRAAQGPAARSGSRRRGTRAGPRSDAAASATPRHRRRARPLPLAQPSRPRCTRARLRRLRRRATGSPRTDPPPAASRSPAAVADRDVLQTSARIVAACFVVDPRPSTHPRARHVQRRIPACPGRLRGRSLGAANTSVRSESASDDVPNVARMAATCPSSVLQSGIGPTPAATNASAASSHRSTSSRRPIAPAAQPSSRHRCGRRTATAAARSPNCRKVPDRPASTNHPNDAAKTVIAVVVVTRGQQQTDRFLVVAVGPEPFGGPPQQYGDRRGIGRFQLPAQHVTEQAVAPVPLVLRIERHDKQVGAVEARRHRACSPSAPALHRTVAR